MVFPEVFRPKVFRFSAHIVCLIAFAAKLNNAKISYLKVFSVRFLFLKKYKLNYFYEFEVKERDSVSFYF